MLPRAIHGPLTSNDPQNTVIIHFQSINYLLKLVYQYCQSIPVTLTMNEHFQLNMQGLHYFLYFMYYIVILHSVDISVFIHSISD